MLNLYEVGALYHPTRTSWPERTDYNYRSGAHELRIFINRPRSEEISSLRRGPAEFALFTEPPVIVLCHRFLPGLPWSDSPYSMHLVREQLGEAESTLPEIPEPFAERSLLTVLLVDASTGILRAMRALSFSPEFTAELHAAIRAQAEAPWNPLAFDLTLQTIYVQHPTSDALAAAAVIKCQGGA